MAEPPALRTSSHDALGAAASSLWTDWKSFKQLFPSSSASDLQSQQTDTRSSQITSSDHGCQTSRCVAPIYERNNPERWYHIIIMNSAHHDWHTQYNTDEPWMYSTKTFLTLCLLVLRPNILCSELFTSEWNKTLWCLWHLPLEHMDVIRKR